MEKTADVTKPSDMNYVATILVGDQFYNSKTILKSLNMLPESAAEYIQKQTKEKAYSRRNLRNFALITSPLYTCLVLFAL